MARIGADQIRIESSSVTVSHLHALGTLPGFQITAVGGLNGPGRGMLRIFNSLASWQAPYSTTRGAEQDVSGGGTFRLVDGVDLDKWIEVSVTAASLPDSYASQWVTLTEIMGGASAPADFAEGAGASTWTVTIKNYSASTITNLAAWLHSDPPENQELQVKIGAVAFASPFNETDGLTASGSPSLASGASVVLSIKRTSVPSGTWAPLKRVRVLVSWDDNLGTGGRAYQEVRGGYRVTGTAVYEAYGVTGSDPVPGVTAALASSATSPITPATTFGSGDHRLSMVRVNKYGLRSAPRRILQTVVSAGAIVENPNEPDSIKVEQKPGGTCRVWVRYLRPAVAARKADTIALWYTNTGVAPTMAGAPDYTSSISYYKGGAGYGLAVFDSVPAQADGVTLMFSAKAKRGAVYSVSATSATALVVRITAAAPAGGDVGGL